MEAGDPSPTNLSHLLLLPPLLFPFFLLSLLSFFQDHPPPHTPTQTHTPSPSTPSAVLSAGFRAPKRSSRFLCVALSGAGIALTSRQLKHFIRNAIIFFVGRCIGRRKISGLRGYSQSLGFGSPWEGVAHRAKTQRLA